MRDTLKLTQPERIALRDIARRSVHGMPTVEALHLSTTRFTRALAYLDRAKLIAKGTDGYRLTTLGAREMLMWKTPQLPVPPYLLRLYIVQQNARSGG